MSVSRRYYVWCKALREIHTETGSYWCDWRGYRQRNPLNKCPKCKGPVSAYD